LIADVLEWMGWMEGMERMGWMEGMEWMGWMEKVVVEWKV
jgi:hypothetical protein